MAGIDTALQRRAVLASVVGAAATAAAALGRPASVLAHDPDDVLLGGTNMATTETSIQNGSNSNTVLSVVSQSAPQAFTVSNQSGTAVFGNSTSS